MRGHIHIRSQSGKCHWKFSKLEKHGGSIFSAGSLLGDSTLNGQDSSLYTPDVPVYGPPLPGESIGVSTQVGNPIDNSQYTDAGIDPTSPSSGAPFLSTLGNVVNDAFKAYTVSQTPVQYRTPANTAGGAALTAQAKTTSYLVIGGVLLVVLIIVAVIFKK